MIEKYIFGVGDYVWYERPILLRTAVNRFIGKITQDCPSGADFEITFLNNDKMWVKCWTLERASDEEVMLAKLEN